MWKYKNKIYKNQKELKDKLGLSGSKFRAKVRDKEIIRINTGLEPYEVVHINNE